MVLSKQPGLDGRHRDITGEIERKRGDTLIGTLRKTYGSDFAPGVRSDMRLDTYRDRFGVENIAQIGKKK
jgi:hypothetical protein